MEHSAPFQQDDFSHVQLIQQPAPQPVTIFQQLPSAVAPPATLRPGHIREDLVELMMMQNAQMHQVIMNNMTVSTLSSFGYTRGPEHSGSPVTAEVNPEVWHHHYPCPPCSSSPAWLPVSPTAPMHSYIPLQTIPSFYETVYPQQNIHIGHRDGKCCPSTTPPSATGAAGLDIPPAAEFHEAVRRQQTRQDKEKKTNS